MQDHIIGNSKLEKNLNQEDNMFPRIIITPINLFNPSIDFLTIILSPRARF
jgi:hypothetical protein